MTLRSDDTADGEARSGHRNLARTLARLFGITFLLVGIAGFIPGITSELGNIKFAGDESEAELLGLFQTSVLHNIVHLLFGIAGLVMAQRWDRASNYLLGGGIIYLLLFVYGLFVGKDDEDGANFLPVNNEDDILHLLLGLGLLASWLLTRGERRVKTETVGARAS